MPLGRLAVTLLAVLCVLGLGRIPLPGMPPEMFEGGVVTNTSVVALGIMPFVTASVLVEVATLIVPAWRRKRAAAAGEPSSSEHFERSRRRLALRLGIAIAAIQAWGIAQFAEEAGILAAPSLMVMVGLVAGSALLLSIAMLVERYGLGSGLATVLATSIAIDGMLGPTVRDRLALGIGVAVTAALAVWALSWQKTSPDEHDKRVLSPVVPEPLGGMMGAGMAGAIIGAYATLAETPAERWLSGLPGVDRWPVLQSIAGTMLAAVCGVVAAYLFYGPGRISALWSRVEPSASADEIRQAVAGDVHEGAVRAGLLSAAVFAVAWNLDLGASAGLWLGAALVEAYRDRHRVDGLVCVDEEVRPWAATAKEWALRRKGVDVATRGSSVERLLPLFGPLAPTLLYVREDEEKRARKVLRRVVGPDKKVAEETVPVRVERARGPSVAVNAALALAALGGAAWVHVESLVQKAEDHARGPVAPVRFELRYVDDDNDLVAGNPRELELAADARGDALRVRLEDAPLGPGRVEPRPYISIEPLPHEPIEKMRDRVAATLAPDVPAGKKLAWGRVTELDMETDKFVETGMRTWVLGDVVLTERDVVDAATTQDDSEPGMISVSIQLTQDGGDRFEEATARSVGRRIALLVDDEVVTAPVVQGVISGGSLRITMGRGDPEAKRREAEELARRLRGAGAASRRQ